MDAELKAIVDRMHRHEAAIHTDATFKDSPHYKRGSGEWWEWDAEAIGDDYAALARMYLREHPADDDEPVTEEWLRSVGFDHHGIGGFNRLIEPSAAWKNGDPTRLFIDLDIPGSASVSMTQGVGGREVHNYVAMTSMPGLLTRGQVRRLCAALGIELR